MSSSDTGLEAKITRAFDSTAMTLEWLVITEDFSHMEQMHHKIRPDHIQHVLPRIDAETGIYSMGGITLGEAPHEGQPLKITGNASVIRGNSKEEVLEEVKRDPYYLNGVWDPSKIQIIPFICAVRNPGGYHGK